MNCFFITFWFKIGFDVAKVGKSLCFLGLSALKFREILILSVKTGIIGEGNGLFVDKYARFRQDELT